jgi:hypothetical protein
VVIVFYFSTAKARIIITPATQEVKTDLLIQILTDENFGLDKTKEAVIKGRFIEQEVRGEKVIKTTGVKTVSTKLEGRATIINNSSKNQVLLATTRLLNEDNILFHIKDRVYIPAGTTLEVDIYADDLASIQGEIQPGKWTIPGLWEGLQKSIYAETKEVLAGGNREAAYVQAKDLSQAETTVRESLLEQAQTSLKQELEEMQLKNNLGSLSSYLLEENYDSCQCNAQEGDEVEQFKCRATGQIKAVVFQKDDLENLITEGLAKNMTKGLKLISFDQNNYSLSIDYYNKEADNVTLKVLTTGLATVTLEGIIVDLEKIGGLTKNEAREKLGQNKFIKQVDIVISPFWLNKVPKVKDRISVEIQK